MKKDLYVCDFCQVESQYKMSYLQLTRDSGNEPTLMHPNDSPSEQRIYDFCGECSHEAGTVLRSLWRKHRGKE